jgi:TPR repeat protein
MLTFNDCHPVKQRKSHVRFFPFIAKDILAYFDCAMDSAVALRKAQAQYLFGVAYDTGQGVTKNSALAFHSFQRAAEAGIVQAKFVLGVKYATGDGVAKDSREVVASSDTRK